MRHCVRKSIRDSPLTMSCDQTVTREKKVTYTSKNYINFRKVYNDGIEFKTQKTQKDKKTSFPKERIENADLYKPVVNKMRTANE